MPTIPSNINGVEIEFDPGVINSISPEMENALQETIVTNIAGETLSKLWVSSAKDNHQWPSRHVTGNAVDISRIDGKKIGEHYKTDTKIKTIVDELQSRFENNAHRRENFGPTIKPKEGGPPPPKVGSHHNHIHFSVNGAHTKPNILQRARRFFVESFSFTKNDVEKCDL